MNWGKTCDDSMLWAIMFGDKFGYVFWIRMTRIITIPPATINLGYVLAFILDLGISVSLRFVSMQGVCRKCSKYKGKQHFLAVLLMFLMLCLTMFARYFSGVAVAFKWYFWWCMGDPENHWFLEE
jgi:hypothetical protein